MHESLNAWGLMRKLTWQDVLLVLAVMVLARVLVLLVRGQSATWRKSYRHICASSSFVPPIARLLMDRGHRARGIDARGADISNIVGLLASIGLVLAFALKDYGSCLVAGMVTMLENTYQPGDWIEVDGTYGEVKAIGLRASTS